MMKQIVRETPYLLSKYATQKLGNWARKTIQQKTNLISHLIRVLGMRTLR